MDIITISSDSEDSLNEGNISLKSHSQGEIPEWESENLYTWSFDDDYDTRPPINYNVDSPKSVQLSPEEEIENFITPKKDSQNNVSMNISVDDEVVTEPYKYTSKPDTLVPSDIEPLSSQCTDNNVGKTKRKKKLTQELKEKVREQNKLEKEKKKAEQQKQKALKIAFSENQRNLKPEENIKFLKVHIDNDIINSNFGGDIISLLQENNIQYAVEPQRQQFTVTWSKRKVEKVLNDFGELTEKVEILDESILLYVLDWEKAVNLIHKNELLSAVETVRSAYYDKRLTLIIMGLEKYFNYERNKRNQEIKAAVNEKKKSKPKPSERIFEEAPKITKDQLEFALTDLQLIGNYNCRLMESGDELSSLILNFTKSLSHIDLKAEKEKRQKDAFGWIAADPHHSIKVDKFGNGLLRLWQQQICQFSSVGLETAQAIVNQYNSPLALINQYENIESDKEGELLLQNIQIRREGGLLSTSRRVGPQLSKKIYKFFRTDDPETEL